MTKVEHDFTTEYLMEDEEAKEICRLGQSEKCCAFLVCGIKGFECVRMSADMSMTIFNRLEEGTMNARGEGEWEGCPWKNS